MSLRQLTTALKASLEAQAALAPAPAVELSTENLTPDAIEANPKDREPSTEPNQMPAADALADVSDSKKVMEPAGPKVDPNPEDVEPKTEPNQVPAPGATATVAVDPPTPAASTEVEEVSQEAINAGHVKGFVGGVFATGSMNKKIEAKKAELKALREKIAKLKERVASAEHYHASRESITGEWTEAMEGAYWDGVKRGYKGDKIEGAKWWQAKRTNVIAVGGKMHDELKELSEQIHDAKEEIKRLEGEYHSKHQAAKEDLSHDLQSLFDNDLESLLHIEPATESENVELPTIESLDDETDHLEAAQEAFQGLNAICTDTEDLAAVTEGLVNVLEMIHAAGDPLTTRDVPFINLAVEGLVGQFGMTDIISPSLESVDNDPVKYVASLEDRVSTAIKQALAWIQEMLKKARDFIVAFFEKIFDRAEWLNRKAVQVKAKADSLRGAKAEATTVAVSSGGEYLLVGGHVDPIKAVDAYLTAVAAVMAADDDYAELFAKSIQAIEALSEKNVPAEELFEKIMDVQAAQKAAMSRPNAFFSDKCDVGYKSELFPGGIYFTAMVNDAGVVSYAKHGGDKVTLNETCKVLSLNDIQALASKVEHLAKGLIDLRKHYSKTNESQLQAALGKLAANIAHLPELNQRKLIAQVRAFGENQTKAWRQSAMVVSVLVKGGYAALACAEKMLAAYKVEAKA